MSRSAVMIFVVLGLATCWSRFLAASTLPLDASSTAALTALTGGTGGTAMAGATPIKAATNPDATILLSRGKKGRYKMNCEYKLDCRLTAMLYCYFNKNSHLLAVVT